MSIVDLTKNEPGMKRPASASRQPVKGGCCFMRESHINSLNSQYSPFTEESQIGATRFKARTGVLKGVGRLRCSWKNVRGIFEGAGAFLKMVGTRIAAPVSGFWLAPPYCGNKITQQPRIYWVGNPARCRVFACLPTVGA